MEVTQVIYLCGYTAPIYQRRIRQGILPRINELTTQAPLPNPVQFIPYELLRYIRINKPHIKFLKV